MSDFIVEEEKWTFAIFERGKKDIFTNRHNYSFFVALNIWFLVINS